MEPNLEDRMGGAGIYNVIPSVVIANDEAGRCLVMVKKNFFSPNCAVFFINRSNEST